MREPTEHLPSLAPQPSRRHFLEATGASLLALGCGPALAQFGPNNNLDVPYVPTPREVVGAMLDMVAVGKGEMLYDLGCGDGRIVIAAASERGARGVGIDLDPERIREANQNAKAAGVSERVKFIQGDIFKANFRDADAVTLYLLDEVNLRLRPQLWSQLRVGARVVSHSFAMGDWPPQRSERIGNATVHLWTITEANKRGAVA